MAAPLSDKAFTFTAEQADNYIQFAVANDKFLAAVEAAASVCRPEPQQLREFQKQFGLLVGRLDRWADEHASRVQAAFLGVRGVELLFLVVQKNDGFDDDLIRDLASLERSIAQDVQFNLIRLDTTAEPPTEPERLSLAMASAPLWAHQPKS